MLLTNLALALLHVRTKMQENFLSVFVFEEAEEVKIWWNWGIQCGTSFAQPWVVLQPRWMRILSLGFSFVCRQLTLTVSACCPACLFHPNIFLSGFLRHGYKQKAVENCVGMLVVKIEGIERIYWKIVLLKKLLVPQVITTFICCVQQMKQELISWAHSSLLISIFENFKDWITFHSESRWFSIEICMILLLTAWTV